MSDSLHARLEKSFGKEILQASNLHLNLGQEFIVTTEDKVRLCMTNHANRLVAKSAWVGPVSLFITIILVLLTADFRDALAVPKATWHAIFLLSVAATAIWSIVTTFSACVTKTSIDNIVAEFKAESNIHPDLKGALNNSDQTPTVEPAAAQFSNGKPSRQSIDARQGATP